MGIRVVFASMLCAGAAMLGPALSAQDATSLDTDGAASGFAAPSRVIAGTVSGRVTDARSGDPVSGVSVTVANTQLGAVTGNDGSYRISGIAAGPHAITARRIGYAPSTQTVTVTD